MKLPVVALSLALLSLIFAFAARAEEPQSTIQVDLTPEADTWATHDDKVPNGASTTLKVGIERQGCKPTDPNNICKGASPKEECCPSTGSTPAFCAPVGTCATAKPQWSAFRNFHTYIRFDLTKVPKGKILKATLNMRIGQVYEQLGGPAKVVTTRLKKIGIPDAVCIWDEKTLADTNGTTWSSLPQNLSPAPGQVWVFDATKAVRDWLTGDTDVKGAPIAENCGFHLYDPDFGNKDAPIERYVFFESKEGLVPPRLSITVAQDLDGDGQTADVDCNDKNPLVSPGTIDVCGDKVDNDCSGLTDDEVCDGADNDCDGLVDEGVDGEAALCGLGYTCGNHVCIKACTDECGGPSARKCVWNEVDQTWAIYGCTKVSTPCYEWYEYEPCNPGQFCTYGSCSSNCVDECDVGDTSTCTKDTLGRWHVALCSDTDKDGCLEPTVTETCLPSATCTAAKCSGGCQDACQKVGAVVCEGLVAQVCMDSDGDGCLDLKSAQSCQDGCTAPLGCTLAGSKPDAGPTDTTEPDTEANDTAEEVAADTATADDTLIADADLTTDMTPEDVALADTATNEAADTTAPPSKVSIGHDDSGCSTRSRGGATPPLVVLLAALLILAGVRSRRGKVS
jgi:hypothetical protein